MRGFEPHWLQKWKFEQKYKQKYKQKTKIPANGWWNGIITATQTKIIIFGQVGSRKCRSKGNHDSNSLLVIIIADSYYIKPLSLNKQRLICSKQQLNYE